MRKTVTIQIKAAILLVVFSTNTIVGFACSLGADMGFNASHHEREEVAELIHVHPDGKKHLHHEENTERHNESKKGDCCNDDVIGIQLSDKNIAGNPNPVVKGPVFTVTPGSFSDINYFHLAPVLPQKHILPFFHPPPSDIGLLFQVFRI